MHAFAGCNAGTVYSSWQQAFHTAMSIVLLSYQQMSPRASVRRMTGTVIPFSLSCLRQTATSSYFRFSICHMTSMTTKPHVTSQLTHAQPFRNLQKLAFEPESGDLGEIACERFSQLDASQARKDVRVLAAKSPLPDNLQNGTRMCSMQHMPSTSQQPFFTSWSAAALSKAPSSLCPPPTAAIVSRHLCRSSAQLGRHVHNHVHSPEKTQEAASCHQHLNTIHRYDQGAAACHLAPSQYLASSQSPMLPIRADCRAAGTAPFQLLPLSRQQSSRLTCSMQLQTCATMSSGPAGAHLQPQPEGTASGKASSVNSEQLSSSHPASGGHGAADVTDKELSPGLADGNKVVLYKGRYMQVFRMLVRFKIFQLVGIAALAVPINTFLVGGSVSSIQMVMATSLIIGCGVASTTLWWLSQRYVGELSLLVPNKLCFSVLDFWGNRQDTVVDMEQLIPPMQRLSKKEKAELIHSTVFPLDVSADRQYLISLRHGVLVDKARLVEILTEGSYSKPESY